MNPMINLGKIKNIRRLITGSILIIAPAMSAAAPNECADWIAKVVSTEGRVETRPASDASPNITQSADWQPVSLHQTLCPGSTVRTQARSRAALLLRNNTVLRLSQTSTLTLPAAQPDKPFWLELLDGAINVITRTPKKFQVDTPFVNAAVDGTEFFVKIARAPLPEGGEINSGQTTVSVFEGRVIAENTTGRVTLRRGEAATAGADQAPVTSIPANPRDAVHWALHYPPILSYRLDDFKEGNETSWQARVRKSIEYTQAGDLQNALASVIDTPQDAAAAFFGYRASLLLNVGRVNEASADIKTALDIAPNDGIALALQSVIAVAQNQYETALTLATQSTAQAPQVAGSWMALSYAQQANFNLPEAINAAQHGADTEPDNALAWARIAELHLMTGNLNGALAAASKAATLNPNLARTQSVLGFVYLTQIKTKHAKQAFEQAITLDQADPLPRLGLGLAKIRDGDLAAGREEIEIATALDPNNALVRSYMGKAYYEEKRDALAATQFYIAKTLDPKDPTPWFYDAILKQSTNRPVEALQDLQKSMGLNDNRAVYRSKLLLDQDLAARSASLARIYQDLDFQQLSLVTGFKSINTDPANASAHRFLAESYASLPRHEIARASEVLQTQLLQPLVVDPLPPQIAERNLNALERSGPSSVGHNEFNPLFVRDRDTMHLSSVAGSNSAWGDELVVGGLHGGFAYSLGQYHYETDGFRANNDLKQDIYNAFLQFSLSPSSSLQIEARTRMQENGDLRMRMDPIKASTALREDSNEDTLRLGYRLSLAPDSELIASIIQRRLDSTTNESSNLSATRRSVTAADTSSEAYNGELQYLSRLGRVGYLIGAGYYDNTTTQNGFAALFRLPSGSTVFNIPIQTDTTENHSNAYLYSYWNLASNLVATLGASIDYYSLSDNRSSNQFDTDQINPKFGVVWSPADATTLRAAAFRVLKRSLASGQTLEPTQVAGLAQFFDDNTATDSTRYGIGLDHKFTSRLFAGLELTQRDLEVPKFNGTTLSRAESQQEYMHRLYVNWMPVDRVALGAEYYFEEVSRDRGAFADFTAPDEVKTQSLPITFGYYSPNSIYFRVRETFYDQQVVQATSLTTTQKLSDNFWLMDLELGYRLPHRLGIVSLEIRNVFDQAFQYEGVNFQTGIARPSPIQPERSVFLKFTVGL